MLRIDGLLLDASITETPTFQADVTSHPVEKGSDVTDNARVRPITLSVEGIVSDTPRGVALLEADRQGNATPSVTAYQHMVSIQATKKLVDIVSDKYGTFSNMFLTSFVAPFSKDTGKSLTFTAQFVQFIIVENNRTVVRTAVGNQGAQNKLGSKQSSQVFPNRTYVVKGSVSFRAQLTKLYGAAPFYTSLDGGGTDYYKVNYTGGQHADGFLTPVTELHSFTTYQYTPLGDEWSQSKGTWTDPSTGNGTTQSPASTGGDNGWNAIMKGLNQ